MAITLPLKGRRGPEKDEDKAVRQFLWEFTAGLRDVWANAFTTFVAQEVNDSSEKRSVKGAGAVKTRSLF